MPSCTCKCTASATITATPSPTMPCFRWTPIIRSTHRRTPRTRIERSAKTGKVIPGSPEQSQPFKKEPERNNRENQRKNEKRPGIASEAFICCELAPELSLRRFLRWWRCRLGSGLSRSRVTGLDGIRAVVQPDDVLRDVDVGGSK